MRFSILLKPNATASLKDRASTLCHALESFGHHFVAPNTSTDAVQRADVDVLVSIGGDGTLLSAARMAAPIGIPVVGVHEGHLGFLTTVRSMEAAEILATMFSGERHDEKRLMLQATLLDEHGTIVRTGVALNDVVLRSADHLLTLSWSVDGNPVTTWRSDGVIVSTPTGSTAYNLSAGGAILEPELEALTVTPLAPQTLTHRPIALLSSRRITLQHSTSSPQRVALDGQDVWWMQSNHTLEICRAPFDAIFWTPLGKDFFQTLRQKLGWNLSDHQGLPLTQ